MPTPKKKTKTTVDETEGLPLPEAEFLVKRLDGQQRQLDDLKRRTSNLFDRDTALDKRLTDASSLTLYVEMRNDLDTLMGRLQTSQHVYDQQVALSARMDALAERCGRVEALPGVTSAIETEERLADRLNAACTYAYALARRLTVLEAEVGDNGKYWRGLAMEHERRLDQLQRPSWGRRLWVWLTDGLWA